MKLLEDYKMGKTIGEGAFSKVKVATHIATGEKARTVTHLRLLSKS